MTVYDLGLMSPQIVRADSPPPGAGTRLAVPIRSGERSLVHA